jgi:hypothetical protein
VDDDEAVAFTQDETLAHTHVAAEPLYLGVYAMGHSDAVDLSQHPDARYIVIRDAAQGP